MQYTEHSFEFQMELQQVLVKHLAKRKMTFPEAWAAIGRGWDEVRMDALWELD